MKRNLVLTPLFPLAFILLCHHNGNRTDHHEAQMGDIMAEKRAHMVQYQIRARGIDDPLVLKAMRTVERHRFIPADLERLAYNDEPLPIGEGQTISQPYIVAYMTEALKLNGNEKVLEIGTGSGYQAAVLAEIVDRVYTIEIVESLGIQARGRLQKMGYKNIQCRIGDGYIGWPEEAPFDAVIVTAAPPEIPQPLIDQLKDGGRMIAPVGSWYQELIRITKKGNNIRKERLIPVRFVPMTGKAQKQ